MSRSSIERPTIEGLGKGFNSDLFQKAQSELKSTTAFISRKVFTGMSEADGQHIVKQALERAGIEKSWHPPKFRIGRNTSKSFREKSGPGVRLQDNDIFFLDLGPVFHGMEADYGETFVHGESSEFEGLANASKEVFQLVSKEWKEKALTGKDLYKFAKECGANLGYKLNDSMAGHRLGDFPHALHYKGSISSLEFTPSPDIWVLEIHLRTTDHSYGSFFEDILIR